MRVDLSYLIAVTSLMSVITPCRNTTVTHTLMKVIVVAPSDTIQIDVLFGIIQTFKKNGYRVAVREDHTLNVHSTFVPDPKESSVARNDEETEPASKPRLRRTRSM